MGVVYPGMDREYVAPMELIICWFEFLQLCRAYGPVKIQMRQRIHNPCVDIRHRPSQCLGLSKIAFLGVPSTSTLAASMPGASFKAL